MRTRIVLFAFMLSLVFILTNLPVGLAQDASCSTLVETAFEQFNVNCAAVPGSSACFGNAASATFADASSEGFSSPGDQVALAAIQSIQTQPLDPDNDAWGLALLNVHANVPLALSEQGLKYVMIGDVQVENAVDAASAFTPVGSLTVVPLVAANLRSAPSTDARVLASAPVGTELAADGLSADAAWLRILSGDQVAWISRQTVTAPDGDIDSLPQIGSNTRTLMQSFLLQTGNDTPACTDVPPSMLVIQSPVGVNASITVNGVDIRFEGTIVLHVSPDNVMQLVVLSGGGSAGGVSVPTGFTLNIPFSPDGQASTQGANGLRPINDGERAFLTPVAAGIASDLLYTALSVPSQEEIGAMLAQINGASGAQVTSGPASGQADCSRFKPTSPISGMPLGVTPFYWDGANGATAYRINVFGADGALISSIDTGATSTTFQIDTGGFGGGSNFAWSVDALVNGQVACSSGRVSVVRDATSQTVSNGGSSGGGGSQPRPTSCSWSEC